MKLIDGDKRNAIAILGNTLAILLLVVSNGLAQDPLRTLPQAYKLQFENDWVKVTRVHYAPHEKLPRHQHTQTASAYVYLNDSGPVVFNHIDLPYGAVTRPPTKAGSFRLYRGLKEIHDVENLSDLPSEFLRVEFKTDPVDEKTLRGKFFREEHAPGQNFQKIQFENEQVRITRLVGAPGKSVDISTGSSGPALLVALSPSEFKIGESGAKTKLVELVAGQTVWVTAKQQRILESVGNPAELLRFDFKTRPLSKDELEKAGKHQHSGS